jgi:hypothetical protein
MEARRVAALQITIPRDFAYRLLGIRAGTRLPRPSAAALIDEAFAEAADLVDARAVLRFSPAGLPGSAHIPPHAPLVAVVCTIGPALEARVAELAAAGRSASAAVLDAVGSAAAEEVADASNRLVCRQAISDGMRPQRRRSPGYGRWDIGEQRALHAFVAPVELGVLLTAHCMMVPRKSVSYVVRLDAAGSDGAVGPDGAVGADGAAGPDAEVGAGSAVGAPPRADETTAARVGDGAARSWVGDDAARALREDAATAARVAGDAAGAWREDAATAARVAGDAAGAWREDAATAVRVGGEFLRGELPAANRCGPCPDQDCPYRSRHDEPPEHVTWEKRP